MMHFKNHPLVVAASAAAVALTPAVSRGADASAPLSLIIVQGAGGEKEYEETFAKWVDDWRIAGGKAGARQTIIGDKEDSDDSLEKLRTAVQQEPPDGAEPLWLVLLGHGTADSQAAKFNLRGEDLSASELAGWLTPMRRPVIVVAAFSTSGAFLPPLSEAGRTLVTATKSGGESNYARFGGYLATTIGDPAADLDHDGQTSLLEAWLLAARQTADFYSSDGRLATEHSLLDDNGDGRGTPSDWFQGLRALKKSAGSGAVDGMRAQQIHLIPSAAERELTPEKRVERDAIEMELAQLREKKPELNETEYFAKLEEILLRLARAYRDTRRSSAD